MTLPVRPAPRSRRQAPPVRRASSRVQASRVAALLVAFVSIAAFYGLLASPAFALRRLDVTGARFTGEDAIAEAAGLAASPGTNAFALDTEAVAVRLRALPAVIDVSVEVALPDLVKIRLVERDPVLAWRVGNSVAFISADGVVLSREPAAPAEEDEGGAADDPAGDPAGGPAGADLPVFADERTGRDAPRPGGTVDPTDLAAARRLGSLTPGVAGTKGASLSFRITDQDGFVLSASGRPWRAVFGIYTPTLRPPDIIPAQVQCLASLLAAQGESKIDTVYLSPEGDRCGTFTTRKTSA